MAGPWEQYGGAPSGPWNNYKAKTDLKKSNPAEYDPQSKAYQDKYGPTAVPAAENFAAGVGKFFSDALLGSEQWGAGIADAVSPRAPTLSGLVTGADTSRVAELRKQVAEKRQIDAPLMASKAGTAGYIGGGLAAAAPIIAIPGANTIAGAALTGAGFGAVQPSESGKETATNIGAGAALGAVSQYVGDKVGNAIATRVANRKSAAAAEQAANSVRDTTLAESRQAGYVVPPATTNPSVGNRLAESVSGKAATQQAAALKNQRVTNSLIRNELGMTKDAPLTIRALEEIRKSAGGAYRAVKAVGEITTDSHYLNDLANITAAADDIAKSFPELNVGSAKEIQQLQDALLRDKFSSNAAVEAIKQLRKDATSNLAWTVDDPGRKALGLAQREAAGILEDQIIRHLQKSGQDALATAFDKARTTIAKTYSVQGALNEGTGNVIATKLAAQLRKGKPLSGGIEKAARFAMAFPKAAAEQTSSAGVSAVDAIVSGVGGATINPSLLAIAPGRIAARSAILSKPYQAAFAAPSYSPKTKLLEALGSAAPLAPAAGVLVPGYVRQK